MPSKPFELPPAAAKAPVRDIDMKPHFRARDQLKQDEIASRQLSGAFGVSASEAKELRLADVKRIFVQIRDHVAF